MKICEHSLGSGASSRTPRYSCVLKHQSSRASSSAVEFTNLNQTLTASSTNQPPPPPFFFLLFFFSEGEGGIYHADTDNVDADSLEETQ